MERSHIKFIIYTTFLWLVIGLVGILCWCSYVPWFYELDESLASRVCFYGVLAAPWVSLLAVMNILQLRVIRKYSSLLLSPGLKPQEMEAFVKGLVHYPARSSMIFLLGAILLAAVVATVQSYRYSTPLPVITALLLAAAAHFLSISVTGYYLNRLAVERFLRIPAVYGKIRGSSSSLTARCLPGLLTAALAVWLMGTGRLLLDNFRTGHATSLWPAFLSGLAALLWCTVLGVIQLHRLDTRARIIMDRLEVLAHNKEPGFGIAFEMKNCDELTELEEAFNLACEAIGRQAIELRTAALDAHEAQKRHLELLGSVCHNLRTPIHSIVGFSQLLLEDKKSLNEEQRNFVHSILRSAHHLLGLVDDVVDLSKMESGVLDVDLHRVDARKVVQEAIEAGKLLAAGKMELVTHLPVDLPEVKADETRLRQILLNLVSNAVKYARRGKVLITVRPENGMVRFSVEDEGPGLPPEYLERIFQEYERAASGDSTSGTGLGLAITRRLVELHGGKITAYNRPQGGAGFSFTIPCWQFEEVSE